MYGKNCTRSKILFNNKFLISCLFLDPCFQHTLTAQQKTDAILNLKVIWDRINEMNSTGSLCTTPSLASNSPVDHFFDEEEELLYEYLELGVQKNINSTSNVYTKIENLQLPFQRTDKDVLMFWKQKQYTDSELYAISNVCFGVPPTQVNMYKFKIILTVA